MFTNRRPYYGLKMSTTDFFREPVRYLKQSNTQESMMEKPYLIDEYPKMHLKLPDFKFKPDGMPPIRYMPGYEFRPEYGPGPGSGYKYRPGSAPLGGIATGGPVTSGGLAFFNFGEADCAWDIVRVEGCVEGSVVITMSADYFFHAEFDFVAEIAADSIGVSLTQLAETEAFGWDKQSYLLTFPEDASGSVTICGFASTHTLVSQTFETVVAGMPVGLHVISGALVVLERGQRPAATLLKSFYGDRGSNCGCIEIVSECLVCDCTDIGIAYTSILMEYAEIQTLDVSGGLAKCSEYYEWAIDSGGGGLSLPTGLSVNYTAPSVRGEVVLSLTVKEEVCETLSLYIHADDEYLDNYDGVISYNVYGDNNWATAHGAATGTSIWDFINSYPNSMTAYRDDNRSLIRRSFLSFDLSSLSAGGTVNSASLFWANAGSYSSVVSAQEGTFSNPASLADYDSFTGTSFGTVTTPGTANQWSELVFNGTGKTYLESVISGTAKIFLRNYTYDYLNVEPPITTYDRTGMWYGSLTGSPEYWPYLKIDYTVP